VSRLRRLLGTAVALRRLALAAIVVNVGIVLTGGAVRLTGSGLGCPTWPRCTDDSYVVTREMGVHGVIEFGNRMLGFVVGTVALLGLVSALLQRQRERRAARFAGLVLAGIAVQGGIGGIAVLTGLNPWIVAAHFLVSMGILAAAYGFWRAAGGGPRYAWVAPGAGVWTEERSDEGSRRRETPGPSPAEPAPTGTAPRPVRVLAATTVAVSAVVLVLGTVVTGSGPHSGDADTGRTGFDPQAVSQLHADAVFLLLGLTVGLWAAVRAAGGPGRPVAVLLGVELAQGLVGLVQYVTDVPAALVAVHMAGACAVWLATLGATSIAIERGVGRAHSPAARVLEPARL
jgi:heme a synthase